MTMVEKNRVPLVKIKVLESQGLIKALSDWLLFLNILAFLEGCVMQKMLELAMPTEQMDFFRKNSIRGFVNRENFLKIWI